LFLIFFGQIFLELFKSFCYAPSKINSKTNKIFI